MAAMDIFQLEIASQAAGQFGENVLHFQETAGSGTDPLADAEALIDGFTAAIETSYLACFATDFELTAYRAKRVSPMGGPAAITPRTASPGTTTGVSYAASIGACLISNYLESTTSKFRTGRIFMPSSPSLYIEGNAIQSAYVTKLNTFGGNLTTTFGTGSYTWQFGIYSRKYNQWYPITDNPQISLRPGQQRRRTKPVI